MKANPILSPLPGEHLVGVWPVPRPESDPRAAMRLNYWAGRALTAESLDLEQESRAARLAGQGRFLSAGVIYGLEVALESPAGEWTLRVRELSAPGELPSDGRQLSVVARVNGVLHFRIFDADGNRVRDLAEAALTSHQEERDQLRLRLAALGDQPVLDAAQQREILSEVSIILGYRLELAGQQLHLLPGHGLTVSGEDVFVPRPLRVSLADLPASGVAAGVVPWASVVVVRPVELREFGKVDPTDPCEVDLSRDAFADERRRDGALVEMVALPEEWAGDSRLGDRSDPRWRNRLAHFILNREASGSARQAIRRIMEETGEPRWETVLPPVELAPWESRGLAVALLSSEPAPDTASRRFFLDRAAVVRAGGLSRDRSRPAMAIATDESEDRLIPPGAGIPGTWRARVDQFAEHLAAYATEGPEAQSAHFQLLPPCGLLPRSALDFLDTPSARALPPSVLGQDPDRAGSSRFFPAAFGVEVAPVPVEDLDAALASSAALAPIDLTATGDVVRVLVPVPQRLFDPRLLVVESEDPFFRSETNRLLALRQDWRQRYEFVSAREQSLNALLTGKTEAVTKSGDDLEIEPPEPDTAPGTTKVMVSPAGVEQSELSIAFPAGTTRPPSGPGTFLLKLRLDVEAPPARLEVTFRINQNEVTVVWTPDLFPALPAPIVAPGEAAPLYPLWRDWPLAPEGLLVPNAVELRGLRFKVEGGRVAIASVGPPGAPWWTADLPGLALTHTGGEWSTVNAEAPPLPLRRTAPFEGEFLPEFPDQKTLAERREELESALNPAIATARVPAMSIEADGLERVLRALEEEANEADDFVDANFTRAQTNLYRIRKLILGETAAQQLLVSPAVATIAEQETAAASAGKLRDFLKEAKTRPEVTKESVNAIMSAAPVIRRFTTTTTALRDATRAGGFAPASISFMPAPNPVVVSAMTPRPPAKPTATIADSQTVGGTGGGKLEAMTTRVDPELLAGTPQLKAGAILQAEALKNVYGQLPETGPTLPPRGLSIGQRFVEPPATKNLSYARSALNELLNELVRLRLPLVNESLPPLKRNADGSDGQPVALLALQGRAKPAGETTTDKQRTDAINALMVGSALTANTDEAEVTLAAIDFLEIKSALLRTIERVIQQRRALIERGREMLSVIRSLAARAQDRGAMLTTRLSEARQDVSVARALWADEVARINAINERRDAVIRNEVAFLAYVRPRTVDPIRRNLPAWHVDAAETPAPVPACLQRHDEPPEPLRHYVQLFRYGPVAWFPEMERGLSHLDNRAKLSSLLASSKAEAVRFLARESDANVAVQFAPVVAAAFQSASGLVESHRRLAAGLDLARTALASWDEQRREAAQQASLGDLMDGRHGQKNVARVAVDWLDDLEQVATCLHAEFAAVPPAIRLRWVERYSEFDRPAPLRDLTVLPGYAGLTRDQRGRLQDLVNWLFDRIDGTNGDPFNLVNDLVRLCLLLASYAPVNQIIRGHLPRATPIRPGILIPIRPANPDLVRVGMEFHIWRGAAVVAHGLVEDARDGEVSARVAKSEVTTLDESVKVQFLPRALGVGMKKTFI